jgi:hypothetical protein
MTPSLCGNNLSDKRSLVAFTWTVTTLLTIIAFMVSLGMIINVHAQYNWHSSYSNNNSNRYLEGGGGDGDGHGSGDNHHSGDGSGDNNKNGEHNEEYANEAFTQSKSGGMSFVAFYLMMVAMGLSLYGTTAIVGFTSLHGDYIAPCFSSTTSSSMKLGMFGGAIILYANVLLVCAVFFGEITVCVTTSHLFVSWCYHLLHFSSTRLSPAGRFSSQCITLFLIMFEPL